jgi:hypothetical protein
VLASKGQQNPIDPDAMPKTPQLQFNNHLPHPPPILFIGFGAFEVQAELHFKKNKQD